MIDRRARWAVLAGLVLARTVVGFEFQSLGSVAPSIPAAAGFAATVLGTAVGAFMLPGIFVSLPAGAATRRWSDWNVLLACLLVMLLGAAGTLLADAPASMSVARALAGAGAAGANVLFSKIVVDLFDDGTVQTAMGLLITSWPLGLGLSLVLLGPLAAHQGWRVGLAGSAAGCLLAVGIGLWLRARAGSAASAPGASAKATQGAARSTGPMDPATRRAVLLAGLVWALFNGALATMLTFTPTLITRTGVSAATATTLVGSVMWVVVVLIPVGGLLADRIDNARLIVVLPLLLLGLACPLLLRVEQPLLTLLPFGALCALPAAAIASMPARVLTPADRAAGMGLFQTVFYAGMSLLPAIGGLGDRPSLGSSGPLIMAGAMFVGAALGSVLFARSRAAIARARDT